MPTNLVVIGDKRISIAYAKHEIKTYTTGIATGIYRWDELLSFLEGSLKRYASVGARILVYHHEQGFIGQLRKVKRPGAFFQPAKVAALLPGMELPDKWIVQPSDETVQAVKLAGWDLIEKKMIAIFKKNEKREKKKWWKFGF